MNLSKLTIYECTPNNFFGKDKKGNEYNILPNGEIYQIEKGSIWSGWETVPLEEVKLYFKGKRPKSYNSLGLEVKDLKWWERSDENYVGTDKSGKVYAISWSIGDIVLRPDISFNPMWFGTDDRLVEAELAKAKEYAKTAHLIKRDNKILKEIKIIFKKIFKKLSKPEILSPKISGFTTYFHRISHGLELTDIKFTEKEIIITDSIDYFDSNNERNEYYIITPDNYLKLIDKLEKGYKPMPIKKLSSYTKGYYKLFENENLKKIFLLFLSLIGYNKKIKDEEEKYMRGEELIKLLCGDEIKYKKELYSK